MSSVPAIWRLMWALHAIESGGIKQCGKRSLARASVEAFHKRYGRSVDQIIADHGEYTEQVEAKRALLAMTIPATQIELVE